MFKEGTLYVYDYRYITNTYWQLIKVESFNRLGELIITKNGESGRFRVSNILWDIMIPYNPLIHK
jgi:hypothetical protein